MLYAVSLLLVTAGFCFATRHAQFTGKRALFAIVFVATSFVAMPNLGVFFADDGKGAPGIAGLLWMAGPFLLGYAPGLLLVKASVGRRTRCP